MQRFVPVFQSAFAAFLVVAVGYNTLAMLNSEDGVRMNERLQLEIAARKARVAELETQYSHLSDRADRLLTAQLDEDLLEERVRGVLGLVRPDEYLVRMEDLDRLAALNAPTPEPKSEAEAVLAAMGEGAAPLRFAALDTSPVR